MHDRHVLSLIRRLAGAGLGFLALSLSTTALANDDRPFPLISLLMPGLQATAAQASPATDELAVQELKGAPQLKRSIDLTTQSDNLWDRIRDGFAMTNLNDDLVLYYQQYYQSRPDALRRMVERSRPYLHHIVEEIEARGMPTELALLPMVESAFNPMAYSKAHAAGLWQFIPATGKRFNLQQNWWQDQRRDIIASTSAALDYLQTIYDMHGDWHLALASYNWGEGAVKRAVEKNEARGLPTDYPSLNMPNETRHYVPKLQALKNIFGNPELVARLDLPRIPNRPYLAMLETPRPMDVKTAARLANLSLEEFQRLNPSHNRPLIKPETPVVIPADKLDTFYANLHATQTPLSEWRAYTVPASDRLDRIASQFGISASELARVNSLPERARLGAGTTLLVPGGGNRDNLGPLLNAMAPTQIIEPEPKPCPKKAKKSACAGESSPRLASAAPTEKAGSSDKGHVSSSGKQANSKASAKDNSRETGGKSNKLAASSTPAKASAPGKQASSKTASAPTKNSSAKAAPATPAKVAKSSQGKRG